jgi:hypothetical protein
MGGNGDFMKKFLIGLFIVAVFSFVSAQSLGVYAQPFGQGQLFSVEYAHSVTTDLSLLGAVSVGFGDVTVDVGVGLAYTMFELEGGDFLGVSRLWVPLYSEDSFSVDFRSSYLQLGVMLLPEQVGALVPVFELGAVTSLTSDMFSSWPDAYLRVGLARRF